MTRDRKTFDEAFNIKGYAKEHLFLPFSSLFCVLVIIFFPPFSYAIVLILLVWCASEIKVFHQEFMKQKFKQFVLETLNDLNVKSTYSIRMQLTDIVSFNSFLRLHRPEIQFTEGEWKAYFQGRTKLFDKIRNILQSSQLFKDIVKAPFEELTAGDAMACRKQNFYKSSNDGRLYLSIDIKTANWTFLRYWFPEMMKKDYFDTFKGTRDWRDFVAVHLGRGFPKSELVLGSKA
jgi:hypothetical protein